MIYLERRPHPALAPFIKSLWYACDPHAPHRHERILPTGHPPAAISPAPDYTTPPTTPRAPHPAAILPGIYSCHQQIDTIDLAELIGILFQPGGTLPFFPTNTQLFTNRETSLEDIWGAASENLRDDLREAPTP